MLTEKEILQLQNALLEAKNPLFFFDDDPDGLSSFLLLYRMHKEGRGVIVKSVPMLDEKFVQFVSSYEPDTIFALDVPDVKQEFIDDVKKPIYWIDHHEPKQREKVFYFNPRAKSLHANIPTTYMAYQVSGKDMWIAAAGCIGDWYIPPFLPEFAKKYPDLINLESKSAPRILFETRLGQLVRIFSFILKGKPDDVKKNYKIMTRIDTPYEILDQTTAQGKFIFKYYKRINDMYEKLLNHILEQDLTDDLLLYKYADRTTSFTSDISNELLYRFPKKVIIIAREKSGKMMMSLRNSGVKNLQPIVASALAGLDGYGGGHEHACGACVKTDDFDMFVKSIREKM